MANVYFEFSDMQHPTASDEAGSEVWTNAPGFISAELHWLLGHTPDYIECYFHAAEQRQFPWVRVRASDENGIIGIWRFDTIEEQFEGGQRIWKAVGRCVLYGSVDNYLRAPRIKADQAVAEDDPTLDDDPNYTEWPILSAKSLMTLEDLEDRYDTNHYRRVNCKALIDQTGCGGYLSPCDSQGAEEQNCSSGEHTHIGFPYCHGENNAHQYSTQEQAYNTQFGGACVYDRNSDRDDFLNNNFAESRYNEEPNKLGPNYAWKGVRRGWVFKDILRHSAGQYDAASRPILGVYNRSADDPIADEGNPIRSNFQQSQQAGVGSNAMAYDVAVSWPWIVPSDWTEIERQAWNEEQYEGDSGYDYRTVWPGKADTYAPSGQAVEIFQRGSQEWDNEQGFSCNEPVPCPEEGPDTVKTYLVYFQTKTVQNFVEIDGYPTRDVICANKPAAAHELILGMGVFVTIVDTSLASYDLSAPATTDEWTNRFPGLVPLSGPGLERGGINGNIVCESSGGISNPCWCESHCFSVETWYGSFWWCSGLVGIWQTPAGTRVDTPPPGYECTEVAPTKNMGVFLHKTDLTKDYLCYHKVPE